MVRRFSLCLGGLFLFWGPAAASAAQEKPDFALCQKQAARIVSSLDDYYLASQVIMTGLDGKIFLTEPMAALLRDHPPGGIMLFRYNLDAEKKETRSFLADCASLVAGALPSGIVPFLAVDHEGGLVHRFGPGVEKLPAAASFWELAQKKGREYALGEVEGGARRSGREIRDLGITMNFAPVAEILTGENRLFLESRSYGSDAAFVEAAAAAFIRGMDEAGVACVVKHFPGNSGADPHGGQTVLGADRETLDRMIRPFAGLIAGLNPPAFMVSHIMVPAWDEEWNASLSPGIIQGRLREGLGFTGIILGDDYAMGAIAASGLNAEDATVAALNAGVDMVMTWPGKLRAAHSAILAALRDGRLKRERLQNAAERIITQKIRYGLIKKTDE
ncbi:MAG: glycoside hydrolase family 3 protein [Treponema sp.]|jgi:beta-N-acetylhexosaminidase|nr:glycoside hydrolase family 3 protein [Treponema sp.]